MGTNFIKKINMGVKTTVTLFVLSMVAAVSTVAFIGASAAGNAAFGLSFAAFCFMGIYIEQHNERLQREIKNMED